MSRLCEQRLWDRMRRNLAGTVHLERVENLMVVGMPDVLALASGHVTWAELKAVEAYPLRKATRVLGPKGLSVAQRNWHMAWLRGGGSSVIVVGVGRDLYAFTGSHHDTVNEYSRAELEQHAFARDWDGVINYLRTHKE